jgi:aminobenzoyl-glutamate transport protein
MMALIIHTAGDSGYVLIIPLGGVIFAAAGRHPLAGIVCAFAGVSGGFSANLIVSPLDTLLQGLTQSSAQLVNPGYTVNPLCNYFFMASSSFLIVLIGWFITDRVIEPKLRGSLVDGDPKDIPVMGDMTAEEYRGMIAGLVSLLVLGGLLVLWAVMDTHFAAIALSHAIVPLIFLLFLVPGTVHGYVAGTVKNHRDIIKGMSKSMSTMGYYMVMAFFAALFIFAFNNSNLGILLAVKGANFLKSLGMPVAGTILGVILITTSVNLLIGSASAKWALLGPIFVPMLMELGLSPEFTQAAYRVGDSSTNIITPLMPYFPLIVVYCQRYVTKTGIGTLISLMLPYSICFLMLWTIWLLIFLSLGLPLGIPTDVGYYYNPTGL